MSLGTDNSSRGDGDCGGPSSPPAPCLPAVEGLVLDARARVRQKAYTDLTKDRTAVQRVKLDTILAKVAGRI